MFFFTNAYTMNISAIVKIQWKIYINHSKRYKESFIIVIGMCNNHRVKNIGNNIKYTNTIIIYYNIIK